MLSELKNRAKDAEDYGKFWDNFGSVLKEGVWEDAEHRAEIAPLLRFRSSSQEGWTSLPDYLVAHAGGAGHDLVPGRRQSRMRCAPRRSSKGFRAKGIEVLLLADPIDAFWPERLDSFEGKHLKSVTQAAEDLGQGRGSAGHLAAAGGAEEGAGRRGGRRARDRPADRQRGGAGGRRQGARICRCSACCAAPAAPCCRRHRCWRSIRGTG